MMSRCWRNMKQAHVLVYLYFWMYRYASTSDVTSEVFGDINEGIVAAFGDFNADKLTDIFVLSDDGKTVYLLQAKQELTEKKASFSRKILMESNTSAITSVAPGDFDGDSQMDLLLLRKAESGHTIAEIHWGNSVTNALDQQSLILNETLKDQPSIIDANGDMIPDLVGETDAGKRVFFVFRTNRTYQTFEVRNGTSIIPFDPLRIPQSSAFVDFNGDLVPDLCLVSQKERQLQFEIWTAESGNFLPSKTFLSPEDLQVCGRPSFYDLNDNQEINIILPGCLDADCTRSAIFVWGRQNWTQLEMDFKQWNFFIGSLPLSWLEVPIALHFGDYNLDGFPDAVTVLKSSSNGTYAAFLLLNAGCSSCEGFSRTFRIGFDQPLAAEGQRPLLCAFYDFMEDGILDVILTAYSDGKAKLRALEQDFTADAYFLKVMVVSGRCLDNCPNGHQPYGVNQVGPVIRFKTTTSTGANEIGVSSQLSQSAYFSLQLPFEVFGLGQTPNFVDLLEVGLQNPPGSEKRQRSWTSIIPNSQVVVVPYPTDSPSSWRSKLYVTPSRLVLLTGISLLATCALIGIITGLLHWRERVEDKREKLQEAQRFHFDAM